jgi:hypothetical protein
MAQNRHGLDQVSNRCSRIGFALDITKVSQLLIMYNTHTNPPQDRANSFFAQVMSTAPTGLLISAALGLAIAGVFQFMFYSFILPEWWGASLRTTISVGLAVFFELLGFYFLVATVRDFSGGHRKEGWLGLLATLMLFAYSLTEAHHISSRFDGNTPESFWAIFGILGTIVSVVRVVEFRIALTVTSEMSNQSTIADLSEKIGNLEKEILFLKGENFRLMSEKNAREESELLEKQRIEQEEADRKRRAESARIKELERLAGVKTSGSIPVDKRKLIIDKATSLYRKTGMVPTKTQVEKELGLSDGSVKYYFKNGSFQEAVEAEISENLQIAEHGAN